MSEQRDDPELTAWALGETVEDHQDDQALAARARVEQAAAFVREVLRSDDVPALDAAQRAEIMRRAQRQKRPRVVPWLLAGSLAVLAGVLAMYLMVVLPAEERALTAARARAAMELSAREAREKAKREAEVAAARAEAERAKREAAAGAACAKPDSRTAGRSTPRMADVDRPREHNGHPRPAKPASGTAASRGSSGGSCDPNDPLCGL